MTRRKRQPSALRKARYVTMTHVEASKALSNEHLWWDDYCTPLAACLVGLIEERFGSFGCDDDEFASLIHVPPRRRARSRAK